MGYYEEYKPEQEQKIVEKPKKKGGFLGKFVALLLGFILGIAAGLGGLVGAGYLIVSKYTVKKTVETANKYLP